LTTGTVTDVAGGGLAGTDGKGAAAGFSNVRALAWDGNNVLYMVDNFALRTLALDTLQVTTIAGSVTTPGVVGGAGSAARFSSPFSLAFATGPTALYVGDGSRIRKLDPAFGNVTSIAGTAPMTGSTDGTGQAALFAAPSGLASSDGQTLYVADGSNCTIRSVKLTTAEVTTLAGGAGTCSYEEGIGSTARFNFLVAGAYPAAGIALDGAGNLFIPDTWNSVLRKMDLSTRLASVFSGKPKTLGQADGTASDARYHFPISAAITGGALYVADGAGSTIRKVDMASGAVHSFVGEYQQRGSTDGRGIAAHFSFGPGLAGLAADDDGNLYFADSANDTIRKIVLATGDVSTFAGKAGIAGSDDGVGDSARFQKPAGLAFDGRGHLVVADSGNSTVRQIDLATAQVTTIAGVAGRAAVVLGKLPGGLNHPEGIAVLPNGSIAVSDFNENAILLIH